MLSICQIKNDVGRCGVVWEAYQYIGNGTITMALINPFVSTHGVN